MPAGHALVAQETIVFAFAQRQAVSSDGHDVVAQVRTHGGIGWQEPKATAMASAMRTRVNILRFKVKHRRAGGLIYTFGRSN